MPIYKSLYTFKTILIVCQLLHSLEGETIIEGWKEVTHGICWQLIFKMLGKIIIINTLA